MVVTTPETRPVTLAVRRAPSGRIAAAVDTGSVLLARHSITALRVAVGVVFLAFAVFKYVPGASPAQPLVEETIRTITFGVLHGTPALEITAVIETTIGLSMITGRFLRVGLGLLLVALVPILSPLVLFPHQMFPNGLPTLTAQYVFKDIVLAAAALVVLSGQLAARTRSE